MTYLTSIRFAVIATALPTTLQWGQHLKGAPSPLSEKGRVASEVLWRFNYPANTEGPVGVESWL